MSDYDPIYIEADALTLFYRRLWAIPDTQVLDTDSNEQAIAKKKTAILRLNEIKKGLQSRWWKLLEQQLYDYQRVIITDEIWDAMDKKDAAEVDRLRVERKATRLIFDLIDSIPATIHNLQNEIRQLEGGQDDPGDPNLE